MNRIDETYESARNIGQAYRDGYNEGYKRAQEQCSVKNRQNVQSDFYNQRSAFERGRRSAEQAYKYYIWELNNLPQEVVADLFGGFTFLCAILARYSLPEIGERLSRYTSSINNDRGNENGSNQ